MKLACSVEVEHRTPMCSAQSKFDVETNRSALKSRARHQYPDGLAIQPVFGVELARTSLSSTMYGSKTSCLAHSAISPRLHKLFEVLQYLK